MHPYSYLALSIFTPVPSEFPSEEAAVGLESSCLNPLHFENSRVRDLEPLQLAYLSRFARTGSNRFARLNLEPNFAPKPCSA
jgi:hypothetical protein